MEDTNAGCARRVRPRLPAALALTVLLALAAGPAAAATRNGASGAGAQSIWVGTLDCARDAMLQQVRHPAEAAILASGRVALPGTGYSFAIPELPGGGKPVVTIVEGDRSRRFVDHSILFARDLDASPIAAVVVTELPEPLQTGSPRGALAAMMSLQLESARSVPGLPVTFVHLLANPVAGLEMLVPGRAPSPCFPTSRFTAQEALLTTMGISQFVVDGQYLLEISLIVPQAPGSSQATPAHARAEMDRFAEAMGGGRTPGLTPPPAQVRAPGRPHRAALTVGGTSD